MMEPKDETRPMMMPVKADDGAAMAVAPSSGEAGLEINVLVAAGSDCAICCGGGGLDDWMASPPRRLRLGAYRCGGQGRATGGYRWSRVARTDGRRWRTTPGRARACCLIAEELATMAEAAMRMSKNGWLGGFATQVVVVVGRASR